MCEKSPDGHHKFAIGYYHEIECIYCGTILRDAEICARLNAAERLSAEDAKGIVAEALDYRAGEQSCMDAVLSLEAYAEWRGK